MNENQDRTGTGSEHMAAALRGLTPEQVAELQSAWHSARPALARYLPLARRSARGADERAEREAVFWARTWESFVVIRARGGAPEHGARSIGRNAALASLSRRSFTSCSPATDPLEPRAALHGGPVRHSESQIPPLARRMARAPRTLSTLERILVNCQEDRKGSSPLERCLVREAIEAILKRHRGAVHAVVIHLAKGSTTQEAARATGVSQGRVSQIRELMRNELAQLGR